MGKDLNLFPLPMDTKYNCGKMRNFTPKTGGFINKL